MSFLVKFTKSNTPPCVFFKFFKNYTVGTKLRKASQMHVHLRFISEKHMAATHRNSTIESLKKV